MTLSTCWRLAQEWYADRLDPKWKPKTLDEARVAFTRLGLRGDFWDLGAP